MINVRLTENATLQKTLAAAILLIIIFNGIKIRTENLYRYFTINTASFFYVRAAEYNETGKYPRYDTKTFAPEVYKENYPPGVELVAVWCYKATKFFHTMDFYHFAVLFPVLVFVIMTVSGYFMMRRLFSTSVALSFCALYALTYSKAALKLNSPGYFTSECLAIFLIVIAYYLASVSDEKKKFSLAMLFVLVMLISTYQPSLSYFLIIILTFLFSRPFKKNLLHLAGYLVGAFILATCFTKYWIGIDYSPLSAINEFTIGLEKSHTTNYRIALARNKLSPMDFDEYIDQFSPLFFFFLIPGLIHCVFGLRKKKYLFPFIGAIVGMVLLGKYIKFRFVAYPFLLIISSIGMADFVFLPSQSRKFFAKAKVIIQRLRKTDFLAFFRFLGRLINW